MKKWTLILLIVAGHAFAQSNHAVHDYSVIRPAGWIVPKTDTLDYSIEQAKGKQVLTLKRKFANSKSASIAYPKKLNFKDGFIELDMASPAGQNEYIGIAFRIKDDHHYETLYFRPGSSGTINAIQYMPEKKAEFNWWDYEDTKYQAKADLPLTGWFHVKAEVKGRQLTVFINRQPKPVFVYKELDPGLQSGSVGFWLGNSSAGTYKNLIIKTN